MRFFTIAAIVLLLAAASEAKTRRIITDREEARKFILDRKERHKEKTRNLLEQRKTQLAEHHAGRKLLSNDDHEKFTRQVKNFERKLNQPEPARSEENQILLEKEIDNFLKMQQGPEIPANWRSDL
uniref:Uncharacterized protein n=1 Tax=Helicotheca tamesis TaxID=374047 RepID=A0A7S2HUZ0_9STRA|mmetsp:Transcript_2845/g.3901  ORF Transcript_2845/g.3901 Transcript_2845/m.3901 type:complete len:126 (+) Transcript_2845:159-536(+)|eukprot:CAMPEP_0185725008 /NCGR_PEP_ID=MMETSP1171-20130828/1337_1 /TAXON_ID=374046 /ORGANISM="Helicotheca tamensis, Strain CCMP826" /LENGTH=125 /DNA_ID=CAMNT_0028392997 /DNA_START=287 /DNA_END=664 /DNA_ORIENTATION=-